jgi:polyhydroxyalkanoate synthase subunit PhaC
VTLAGTASSSAEHDEAVAPEDPQEWLRHAESCHGSWWPDYASWLAEHCGEETAAPGELGGGGLEPIGDAPGTYVYDR